MFSILIIILLTEGMQWQESNDCVLYLLEPSQRLMPLWRGVGMVGREWVEQNCHISLSFKMRAKIRLTRRIWGWAGKAECLLHARG